MARDPIEIWIDKVIEADPAELDIEELEQPTGPPLTPEEIKDALGALRNGKAQKRSLSARCVSKHCFNRPQLKFLQDASCSRVSLDTGAQIKSASQGRRHNGRMALCASEKNTHNIQVTSTHGGRKLGEEYRTVKGQRLDPVDNWVARAESIPEWLDAVVRAKSQKHYGSSCWLVVYLNISEGGIRQKETEALIALVKARYAMSFEAISVLWKGRLY